MFIEHSWNDSDGGKTEVLGEKLLRSNFVPIKSTWTALGWNPNVCSERLADNCMTSESALLLLIFISNTNKSSIFIKTC
jgi:hypothetical protein